MKKKIWAENNQILHKNNKMLQKIHIFEVKTVKFGVKTKGCIKTQICIKTTEFWGKNNKMLHKNKNLRTT